MPDLIRGPYVRWSLSFIGGTGVDTSFLAQRRLTPDGPYTTLAEAVPLLGERAVFIDNTAPIGADLYYLFTGDQTGDTITVGPVVLPVQGYTWIKDPGRPWADLRFDTCPTTGPAAPCTDPNPAYVWGGLSGLGQAEDAGLFEILNSDVPADVWARRKSITGTLVFFTRTLEATDRVYDLFTAGGPLQLQLPDIYGWADAFIQPGELRWEYGSRDQRKALRRYEVPFRVVGRPLGPIQGVDCANWCEVQEAFPTFGDMSSVGQTWLELAQGDVLCPPDGPGETIQDTFTRTVPAGGWGVANTGQTWVVSEGPAAEFAVNGTVGVQSHPVAASDTFHTTTLPWVAPDTNLRVDFALTAAPAGASAYVFPVVQYADTTHMYMARVEISSIGAMSLTLRKRDGAETSLAAAYATGFTYVAGAWYTMRLARVGTTLRTKIWLRGTTEPTGWQISVTDAALSGPASVGVRSLISSTVANAPIDFHFDNLWVGP
ncbi:hypothetical protein ABZ456_29040 [Streptomyces sp. NPDC005776]|uniref:hypothetical protein n=1 Tax=Streptomyces sp. NPDC005776 TaxID=3154676 RepID=UPI0033D054DA